MKYISHRVNTIENLIKTPKEYGVEIDLRDSGNRIILQHDPFKGGQDFEEYLEYFNHGTMILNIKSEGIELKVLELLKKYNIKHYFFLDSSFPMIHKLSKGGEKNIAIRFSEFEGVDTILNMSGKINWIWVDCFSKLPITVKKFNIFRSLKFKLCLVSPELQKQEEKLEIYKKYLYDNGMQFDAVCTKLHNIVTWKVN